MASGAFPDSAPRLVDYRCPNGHRVTKVAASVVALGSPQRRCRQCGVIITVPQYREWADMTPEQQAKTRKAFVVQTALVGSFIGFMIATSLEVAAVLGRWSTGAMALGAVVAYAIGLAIYWGITRLRVRSSLARTDAAARSGERPPDGRLGTW
jgi:hypothetical protein